MKTRISGPWLRGDVEVFSRLRGVDTVVYKKRNLIVNEGSDVMAQAVAGGLFVNGMYLNFTNSPGATPPFDPVTVDRTAELYQTSGSIAPLGVVRVPTLAQPEFSTSDNTKYNGNQVRFTAISDSNVLNDPGPAASLIDGVSNFYGAALLYLDPEDLTQDLLLAAVNFDDFVVKVANAQIGVRWTLTFTTPVP
jgi:hypothetical protein